MRREPSRREKEKDIGICKSGFFFEILLVMTEDIVDQGFLLLYFGGAVGLNREAEKPLEEALLSGNPGLEEGFKGLLKILLLGACRHYQFNDFGL